MARTHTPLANRKPSFGGWSSFLADSDDERPRILHEDGNPTHRLRVEHSRTTLLVHLSDEDGAGWTVMAVDRPSRRWAVAQAPRQLDAAKKAYSELYPSSPRADADAQRRDPPLT
jgi:hypothetical protein